MVSLKQLIFRSLEKGEWVCTLIIHLITIYTHCLVETPLAAIRGPPCSGLSLAKGEIFRGSHSWPLYSRKDWYITSYRRYIQLLLSLQCSKACILSCGNQSSLMIRRMCFWLILWGSLYCSHMASLLCTSVSLWLVFIFNQETFIKVWVAMTWKRCGIRSRACPPDFEEHLPGEQNTGQVRRTVDLGNIPQTDKEGCAISCGQSSHLLSTSTRAELVGSVFPCGPRMLLCLLLWDCEVQAEILH